MEKELLISKLKEKIGTTNVSDKTMNAYVDAIMPQVTNDEMVNDTFLDIHSNTLKVIGGQISSDASAEINRYKANLKEKTGDDSTKGMESILTLLNEIKSENELLKSRLDKQDLESKKNDFREKVINGMKAKGANDAYVLKNVMRIAEIDPLKDLNETVESLLGMYDKEYKEARGDGEAPRSSQGMSAGKIKEALDAFFEKKAREGKFPTAGEEG